MFAVYQETCYLHRMKPDEVLKYEDFLDRRIKAIEDVVRRHFEWLDKVFEKKKQDEFDNEIKKTKAHGI